jgi:uncharacterized protein (DUF697 family)
MKPFSFLSLYEKLESLVQRLPEPLQQPILKEITPIKTLFLLQRAPRIVLLGQSGLGKVEIVNALFGSEVVQPGEENLSDGAWQTVAPGGRGALRLLDARRPVSLNMLKAALTAEAPDLFLFIGSDGHPAEALTADLDHAEQILSFTESRHTSRARMLGILVSGAPGDAERARQNLHSTLHSRTALSDRMAGTLALAGGGEADRLAQLIAIELPGEAHLEMARLSGNRALQKQIAQIVIKSVTAISAAVGAQPIPLADFPILTSLQAGMVASIMHISGREMSPKLAGEFIAAVGANVGVGLVLREGARGAIKLLPFWGNAISGAVAATGTYTIGRSAVGYFIEGLSMKDAQRLLQRKPKEPLLLE